MANSWIAYDRQGSEEKRRREERHTGDTQTVERNRTGGVARTGQASQARRGEVKGKARQGKARQGKAPKTGVGGGGEGFPKEVKWGHDKAKQGQGHLEEVYEVPAFKERATSASEKYTSQPASQSITRFRYHGDGEGDGDSDSDEGGHPWPIKEE
ncbi:hypothetical protein LX32DRAFT_688249 [Colletotrichum zoysiae]|uniref:Uncharacterized protein n=1 Tax=Colletotrichum zoysiae TaxID=1216348 RepID=A0AAD9H270_9PEZI|nr:hypothetical protein LX32DRAFT_688249 [Colletotrichum zoysiae]